MSEQTAFGPIKRVQIEAVVIRADGTRENIGVVSDSKWRAFSARKFYASWRIRKANRRAAINQEA